MDNNKARRVLIDAFVMEGYDDYGNWAEDPNGTHMLVPVETWERVVEELLGASRSMLACAGILGDDSLAPQERIDDARPYISSRSGVVRRALEEIGGEDDRDIVKLDIEEMRKQWESGECEMRRRDALEADDE